ncbi:MAG: DUF6498-containing protein [Planctomycetota bacterium]
MPRQFFPSIRPSDLQQHRVSVASLLVANGLPLLGVLFLNWKAFDVVILYWLENVVIGVINVLKMLTCWPDAEQLDAAVEKSVAGFSDTDKMQAKALIDRTSGWGQSAMQTTKLFFVPFFTVHYGLFCLVHGVFVVVLLGGGLEGGVGMDNPAQALRETSQSTGFWLAATGLAASHLVSYFKNFLAGGEYRRTAPPLLMMQPYGRVVVLHVAIVLSGFLTFTLGSPIWLLILLVIGKTWFDLGMHLREHRDTATTPTLN